MRSLLHLSVFAVVGVLLAAPALAAPVQIPDPADISLFGLGVAGLVLGRWAAGKKSHD